MAIVAIEADINLEEAMAPFFIIDPPSPGIVVTEFIIDHVCRRA